MNGRGYKTIVVPTVTFGAETKQPVKEAQKKKMQVAEMRMLVRTSGVTKLDIINSKTFAGQRTWEKCPRKHRKVVKSITYMQDE